MRLNAGFDEPYELAGEAFWAFRACAWARLKPVLQYVVHPGGDGAVDDGPGGDADGPGHLRKSGDRGLDVRLLEHHQVREFVDAVDDAMRETGC